MTTTTHDAGQRGCGDGLASWFRDRLGDPSSGDELVVVVRDPAAPVELPALARLLGHTILSINPVDETTVITVRRATP